MSVENRVMAYKKAAIDNNARDLRKFRAETNDYYCRHEDELIDLIGKIPNWETYLTDKQLVITKNYLSFLNTSAIEQHLKLSNGVAYHTLFGSNKNNKLSGGVLKKLRGVYQTLQKIEAKKGVKK